MTVQLKRRRFTLDQYHRMGQTGILGADDRVELVEGEVVELSAIQSRHAGTVARLSHLFSTRLDRRAIVWSQNPLLLTQHQSEARIESLCLVARTHAAKQQLPQPAGRLDDVE